VNRMRFVVAIMIVWLFLFYNIERISPSINVTDVAYTFTPVLVAVVMLTPRLRRMPLWLLLVLVILVFLIVKTWIRSQIWGPYLFLTVTEACAIALTTIMARSVSMAVSEFESAVSHISIGPVDQLPESSSTGQAKIYQEVRRARNYERPLTLMAIGVEDKSIDVALDRMVQQVQHAMMKQYALSGVAKALCSELQDYNTIAQSNDHFLVVLPEVTRDRLPELTERLRKSVVEQVGVNLKIGAACLPGDAPTFEGLVERAVQAMEGESQPQLQAALPSQRLSVEHHAT
jgi:GGDEF domain-containing protein